MKTVRFLAPARKALAKHRNVAERLIAKIEQYAETPEALAN